MFSAAPPPRKKLKSKKKKKKKKKGFQILGPPPLTNSWTRVCKSIFVLVTEKNGNTLISLETNEN